jgi:hypothetical protein
MSLSAAAIDQARAAHPAAVAELLNPAQPKANIVGVGVGNKWKNGQPTGEAALVTLVTHKMGADQLSPDDLVPPEMGGVKTDVLAVGFLTAGVMAPPRMAELETDVTIRHPHVDGYERVQERAIEQPQLGAGIQVLTQRARPAKGGNSVGHFNITAGTIATCVYDILPGGTISPPMPGIGMPGRFYILSNNHVLANSNAGSIGDPVLQPGPYDGGTLPGDQIARLSRYIPVTFSPPIPLPLHRNLVDCAVAEGDFQNLDRDIYWTGPVRGWRTRANVLTMTGQTVKKTGRTTNLSMGRITVVNATVDVNYGGGRVARFMDQIVTTAMSAGGDSGSLLLTGDSIAVGLLFAGSPIATIFNQIENVRSLLRVEVAEQIL